MKGHSLVACLLLGCGSVSEKAPDAAPPTVTVTVVADGTGTGTVVSEPARINCGASCVEEFPEGETVILTATPELGSVFTGWGGACSGANSCVFTPTGNTAVTATFTKTQFSITVTKSGAGSGSIASTPAGLDCGATCTFMFDAGSTVTLTSTPTAGHNFRVWAGGGCTGGGTCDVTLTGNVTVDAQFTIPSLFLADDTTDTLQKVANLATPTVANVGALGIDVAFGDCVYNSNDGNLYLVDGRGPKGLYRVNMTTGAAQLVGLHNIIDMFALGYHPPSNTLYGVGNPAYTLYTINLTTGAATVVASTAYTNGMAWDSKRNQMIAITSGGVFKTIDLATGVQTDIAGSGPVLGNNNGIAYDKANDVFWMASYTTNSGISKFDPNNNYAAVNYPSTGVNTCIAYVP